VSSALYTVAKADRESWPWISKRPILVGIVLPQLQSKTYS
jgi:hypothetical protein